jgi:hypothetical protein
MVSGDRISREQLLELVAPFVPQGVAPEEVASGVGIALTPPGDLTLPLERDLFHWKDVVYAWREEDASATKLALEVLGEVWGALISGPEGVVHLGIAIKELVAFLVELHRHRVRIDDPLKIAVLFILRENSAGLTAAQIAERLRGFKGRAEPPAVAEIETILKALANEQAKGGPKALVRADGLVWKSLV